MSRVTVVRRVKNGIHDESGSAGICQHDHDREFNDHELTARQRSVLHASLQECVDLGHDIDVDVDARDDSCRQRLDAGTRYRLSLPPSARQLLQSLDATCGTLESQIIAAGMRPWCSAPKSSSTSNMSPVDNGSTWRHLPSQLIWNHDYTLSSSSSSIDHMSTTLVQSSATSWQRGKWILPSRSVETWHAVRVLFKRRFDTLQFCSARVRDDCILVFCDRPCATEVLALLLRHLPPPERSCGKWEYRDSGDRVVATFVHPPGV